MVIGAPQPPSTAGEGDTPDAFADQPEDERIVSTTLVGPSANNSSSHHHFEPFSGYGSSNDSWNTSQPYRNPDALHVVSPVVYNDNPSVMYHSGYGFNADITYGQYSPVTTPLPGQFYSPQQLPFSPSYFPQRHPPNMPHISSPTEPITPETSSIDAMFFGPASGYYVNFGGGNLSGNVNVNSTQIPSPTAYPQPVGILRSYENNSGQASQQQRSSHGFGLGTRSRYAHGGSYQSSSFGGASFPYVGPNDLNQPSLDKGRRREKDQDSVSVSNDSHNTFNDRNRGPRASKGKGKSPAEQSSSSGGNKKNLSASGILLDSYNRLDFATDYEDAKFFVIKSFGEDNVHKSIKYNVWASTPQGNKKLDAAYQEAKEINPNCPVFLFFSVNASGQFCGVAEMVRPVNFEEDADYWQQDRWSGQFPVQWHIVKDVPNIRFHHILLDNNDNKPVTHSRDSQEVGYKQGIEMLKIFKDHDARTSILDDFSYYDDREKALKERKARQQAFATTDAADNSTHEMPSSLAEAQNLVNESIKKVVSSGLEVSSSQDTSASSTHESLNQLSSSLSQRLVLEDDGKRVTPVSSDQGSGSEIHSESVDKNTNAMLAANRSV